MSETDDPNPHLDRLRDLPIRSDEIGFAADALLTCGKCGRTNAPNRPDCMYCGTRLEGSTAEERIDVRELESWENGFNVVVLGAALDGAKPAAAMLASTVGMEPEVFESVLTSRTPLPVARLESERQASILIEKLADHGVKATVVADDTLSPHAPPIRLRGLEFGRDEIVLLPFSGGADVYVGRDDIAIIVPGLVYESRTESIEKRKRKVTTTVGEATMSSDETVIDIYSRSDEIGWRIPTSGFDFSCLGADKTLLAADNMERLIARLQDFAPEATVVLDYLRVRPLLEHCWPSESRKDGLGFKRSGFARKDISSVYSTNNSLQLLKYSRLRRRLV
jgi:hypothetical protein